MQRLTAFLAITFLSLCSTGCFHFRTVVHVNVDGSGTVTEDLGISPVFFTMVLGDSPSGDMEIPEEEFPFDKNTLQARAERMGTVLQSFERYPDLSGYRAVYAFDEIQNVAISVGMSNPDNPEGIIDAAIYAFERDDEGILARSIESDEAATALKPIGNPPRPGEILLARYMLDMMDWEIVLETPSTDVQLMSVDGPQVSRTILDDPQQLEGASYIDINQSSGEAEEMYFQTMVQWLQTMRGVPGVLFEEEVRVEM